MSRGQLLALVKNNKLKTQKGKGKGKGNVKTCYECGAEGHIASDCSVRNERVAAGGPERLPPEDVQMGGGKGGKAIGKGGKGRKGGVKGGDGKGSFGKGRKGGVQRGFPPKAIWRTLNPDPALIRNAQWMRWHGYLQQLSAAWEQPAADWSGPEWITVPGARLSSLTTSRTVTPKIATPKT